MIKYGNSLKNKLTLLITFAAIIISLLITAFLSFLYFYSGIEELFSEQVRQKIQETDNIAKLYFEEHINSIKVDSLMIQRVIERRPDLVNNPEHLKKIIDEIANDRFLSEIVIFTGNRENIATSSYSFAFLFDSIPSEYLEKTDEAKIHVYRKGDDKVQALSRIHNPFNDGKIYLLVGRYLDRSIMNKIEGSAASTSIYSATEKKLRLLKKPIITIFTIGYIIFFFVIIILAKRISHLFTIPIQNLVKVSARIKNGEYGLIVPEEQREVEIMQLSNAFNQMSRSIAQRKEELELARDLLNQRNHFIESVMEEITVGVVVLDANNNVCLINDTAKKMVGYDDNNNSEIIKKKNLYNFEENSNAIKKEKIQKSFDDRKDILIKKIKNSKYDNKNEISNEHKDNYKFILPELSDILTEIGVLSSHNLFNSEENGYKSTKDNNFEIKNHQEVVFKTKDPINISSTTTIVRKIRLVRRPGCTEALLHVRLIDHNQYRIIITLENITAVSEAERLRAWADVAQKVAHEIKNPLTPIHLAVERLESKFLPEDYEKKQKFLRYTRVIMERVVDIQKLLKEFTTFSRIASPKIERCNIVEMINDILFLEKSVNKNISYHFVNKYEDKFVYCDKMQIMQVLMNILKNSAESVISKQKNGEFSGLIEINLEEIKDLSCNQGKDFNTELCNNQSFPKEDFVFISIRDNGGGLVFSPVEGLSSKAEGSGIGLAIVKKILDGHEGSDFQIKNTEKKEGGAIATFYLKKYTTK